MILIANERGWRGGSIIEPFKSTMSVDAHQLWRSSRRQTKPPVQSRDFVTRSVATQASIYRAELRPSLRTFPGEYFFLPKK